MTLDRNRAAALLAAMKGRRILVIGDLMLDRYVHGEVSRISPEAPVPVVHVKKEHCVPGGACNVALNIQALGGQAALCGIMGEDDAAEVLLGLLRDAGGDTGPVVQVEGLQTTSKTRVIAARQQVCRVDREHPGHEVHAVTEEFLQTLEMETKKSDGIILEDYGKGVVQQAVVDAALAGAVGTGIPSGFDPKDNHALNVKGVTVATPNRKEAYLASNMAEPFPSMDIEPESTIEEVSKKLFDLWSPEFLLVTLGPQGMVLCDAAHQIHHVPTRAREVFDVSGAGDTVIAVCLLALAAGAAPEEAAELANFAAGVVVAKLGTATCTPEEILDAIAS